MDDITVLKFFATWCKPCRIYTPTFDMVTKKLGVNTINVDVDKEIEIKESFGVTSIPATVIIDNKTGNTLAFHQGKNLLNRELTQMIEEAAQHG